MSAVRRALSVFRPDLFDGRVAIVTGGATGIGRAIAAELAQLSCKVVIASRNADRLSAAAEELSSADGVKHEVQSVVCNIRNPDEVRGCVPAAQRGSCVRVCPTAGVEVLHGGYALHTCTADVRGYVSRCRVLRCTSGERAGRQPHDRDSAEVRRARLLGQQWCVVPRVRRSA